jgi:hypothetical protein
MNRLELILAIAATLLQCAVAFLVVRSRALRQFPFFFSCIILSVAITLAAFLLRDNYRLYFYFYWVAESVNVVLTLSALHEVFFAVFRSFYRMGWFRLLFPAVSIFLLSISALRTALHPAADVFPLFGVILSLEISVRFLQVGLFGLFVVLASFFHLRWQQRAFGIAFGFGLSAAGSLVVFLLRSEFGTKMNYLVRIAPPLSYTLAVVVWLITFLAPQPKQPLQGKRVALTPEEMLAEVRQYTRTVKEILKK